MLYRNPNENSDPESFSLIRYINYLYQQYNNNEFFGHTFPSIDHHINILTFHSCSNVQTKMTYILDPINTQDQLLLRYHRFSCHMWIHTDIQMNNYVELQYFHINFTLEHIIFNSLIHVK